MKASASQPERAPLGSDKSNAEKIADRVYRLMMADARLARVHGEVGHRSKKR